jgi:2-keto-myo-inositol isomerase
MPGPRQALAVVGASTSRNVGIMMDTFHYYKSGIPLEEIRRLPKEHLLIVHVNDCPELPREQMNDSHRVYPGHGVIPLVEEFRILKNEIGYTGFLSIEIFNRDYWADSHENVIRNAKAALDAVLAKI